MITVESLWVYPIKSCQGVAVDAVGLTAGGFETDRRMMLVDSEGRFVTQRECHALSRVKLRVPDGYSFRELRWVLSFEGKPDFGFALPDAASGIEVPVSIWRHSMEATEVLGGVSEWFSDVLGQNVRLIVVPDQRLRRVNPAYGRDEDRVGFADGYPALVMGRASVEDLSQRAGVELRMERFRPNIVLAGLLPYEEDELKCFRTPNATFYGVKPCDRCVITTIDPTDQSRSKEPLKTLSTFRRRGGEVFLGMNLVFDVPGKVCVGDPIEVVSRVTPVEFN